MSTRCTINFCYGGKEIAAKVYRHYDGYPEGDSGVLEALQKFFAAVEADTEDTRFSDPTYLAAKFVVWQADQMTGSYENGTFVKSDKKMAFTGVGVCIEDPGDIEYTYYVDCKNSDTLGRPEVTYKDIYAEASSGS
jgi:hypothetical protein